MCIFMQSNFLCMHIGILLVDLLSYWINHTCLFLINAMRWVLIYNLEAYDGSFQLTCFPLLTMRHEVLKSAMSKRTTLQTSIEFPSWTRQYHKTICEPNQSSGSLVISYRVHWSQSVCNHFTWLIAIPTAPYHLLGIAQYYENVKLSPLA